MAEGVAVERSGIGPADVGQVMGAEMHLLEHV